LHTPLHHLHTPLQHLHTPPHTTTPPPHAYTHHYTQMVSHSLSLTHTHKITLVKITARLRSGHTWLQRKTATVMNQLVQLQPNCHINPLLWSININNTSLSHTHTHTHTFSLFLPLSPSLTLTLSHTCTHTHTHTHT